MAEVMRLICSVDFDGVNSEDDVGTSTSPTPLADIIADVFGSLTGTLTTEQKQQLVSQIIQAILNQQAEDQRMCQHSYCACKA